MTDSSASERSDRSAREGRIRQVVSDHRRRRESGESVSDDEVIAAHPDLMPDLAQQLRRLQLVVAARAQADQRAGQETDRHEQDSSVAVPSGLHIRCPHCHTPVVVAADTPFTDITCSGCGSHFSLVGSGEETRAATPVTSVGHFQLIERLGLGGFGTVWKARDTELDRAVAVKIPRHGQLEAHEVEQFLREARTAAQLNHPNIVAVHEVGRDGETIYIVSDLVRGAALSDWLTGQKLSIREAAELCRTIALALDHAHQAGVIHRDLKPHNIMMDADGQPHLMDFGLARREASEITMTVDGQVLGTPAYMSPEQAQGESHQADRHTDIYSLGVILFELITGELPFRGNVRMLIHQVVHEEPPSPRKLNGGVPRDLETICLKCLEKEPQKRPTSAAEVAEELERFLSGKPIQARRISPAARAWRWCKRNPAISGLAATLTIALLVGLAAVTSLWIRAEAETRRVAAEKARADKTAENLSRRLYVSLVARAYIAVRDDKLSHARKLLEACPEKLRHWEWSHLNRRARPKSLLLMPGSEVPLFTHDGRHIITASWGPGPNAQEVMVWDASTGAPVRTLHGHATAVVAVARSHDTPRFITGSEDGTLILWDAQTWQAVWKQPNAHRERIDGLALSPSGATVASVSRDGTLKVWDAGDGAPRFAKTLENPPRGVAFSPDGKYVVSSAAAGSGGPTTVWDAVTGSKVHVLQDEGEATGAVAFSPDGRWIVTGSTSGVPSVWSAETWKRVETLTGHAGGVSAVTFSPDGNLIASGGADTTVRLWDAPTGQELATFAGHEGPVLWLSFSPDGTRIASFSGFQIYVWDAAAGPDVLTLRGHQGPVEEVAFSPDGQQIASTGHDGTVRLWDAGSGEEVATLQGHEDFVSALAYHPVGRLVATGSRDGIVKLWDTVAGKELRTLRGHQGWVRSAAFSPDGVHLATSGNDDRTVRVWHVATGDLVHTLVGHSDDINEVAYSPPDGKWIASACDDDTVRLWDAATGQMKQMLQGGEGFSRGYSTSDFEALAFSPDGRELACGIGDGTIKLWNLATRVAETLRGVSGRIRCVVFSSNARRVFSGGDDHTVSVWDPVTAEQLLILRGHEDSIWSVAVSPNGKTVATASYDGTIRLWETAVPPAGGQTARSRVEIARRIVDMRYKRLTFARDVIASLRVDDTLDAAIRKIAVRIATARGDNAHTLNRESWTGVKSPDQDAETYRLALSKADIACRVVPESAAYRSTLGIAHYRLGNFERALATLERADKVHAAVEGSSHPCNVAFIAMTRFRLGQPEKARKELDRLRALTQDARRANTAEHAEYRAFLHEAEELIGGAAGLSGPNN